MSSLDPEFHYDKAAIHREHEELVEQLDRLDAALEQIVCYSEVFTDLTTASQVASSGTWMIGSAPMARA